MRTIRLQRIALLAFACLLTAGLAGCGKAAGPSKDEVRNRIAQALPGMLVLDTFEYESTENNPDAYVIKFKAVTKARENLCEDMADLDNGGFVLQVIYPKGAELVLYGDFTAEKNLDRWSFSRVSFDRLMGDLPRPQSSFPPNSLLEGTPEAERALRKMDEQAAKRDQELKAAQELQRQQELADANRRKADQEVEQARLKAEQERLVKEREQRLQAIAVVVAPGSQFEGTLTYGRSMQNAVLKVESLDGTYLVVELSNPDSPTVSQRFAGNIDPDAQLRGGVSIKLKPMAVKEYNSREVWSIYRRPGDVELNVTPQGLDGRAITSIGERPMINLRKVK